MFGMLSVVKSEVPVCTHWDLFFSYQVICLIYLLILFEQRILPWLLLLRFILFFTFPGALFTFGGTGLLLWYIFFVVHPRRFKVLADYYHGTFARANISGYLVSFTYDSRRYGIKSTSIAGIGVNNWLVTDTHAEHDFFIGH